LYQVLPGSLGGLPDFAHDDDSSPAYTAFTEGDPNTKPLTQRVGRKKAGMRPAA
jgi:hypothetical protein